MSCRAAALGRGRTGWRRIQRPQEAAGALLCGEGHNIGPGNTGPGNIGRGILGLRGCPGPPAGPGRSGGAGCATAAVASLERASHRRRRVLQDAGGWGLQGQGGRRAGGGDEAQAIVRVVDKETGCSMSAVPCSVPAMLCAALFSPGMHFSFMLALWTPFDAGLPAGARRSAWKCVAGAAPAGARAASHPQQRACSKPGMQQPLLIR